MSGARGHSLSRASAYASLFGLLLVLPAAAEPIVATGAFHFRDIRSENTAGVTPGDRLSYGLNVTPNPRTGDAGTVVTAVQGGATRSVPYLDSPASPNEYFGSTAFNAALTGSWTLTVANPSSPNTPVSANTPTVLRPDGTIAGNTEFVQNMSLSGSGTNLTFNFNAPPGSQHSSVSLRIFDLDRINSQGAPTLIFVAPALSASTTTLTLPSVLNQEGDALKLGNRYSVSIELDERRQNGSLLSRSRSFFNFTPLKDGAPPQVVLPTVGASGVYNFNTTVTAGQTVFIDPFVAVGYDYAIGAGNPNFASVLLPMIGDGLFDLYLFDGVQWVLEEVLQAGVEFSFEGGGVSLFRILGIEPEAGLNPADVTAFITGLTFVADGRFTGTMTPIVLEVPDTVPAPSLILLLLGSISALTLASQRRRREQD